MKERMHIYRVAVPDIPAGGSISSLPLQLDSDAPFTARAISFAGADGGVTLGDVTTLVRFRGPNGLYRSSDFIPAFVLCPASGSTQYLGNGTAWRPLYPEITWPENATILIDVKNTGAVTLSGMVVFFRGVKQYQDSRDVPGSSVYPGSYSSTAFDLSRWVSIPDVGMVDNIALNAPSDGSIVLRGALLCISSPINSTAGEWYANLRGQIQDLNHKSYSNDDIEVNWLYGCNPGGNMMLFFPQIWLPPSGILYYRFVRNDPGAGQLDLNVVWKGSKVFQR